MDIMVLMGRMALIVFFLLFPFGLQAQIRIGGNVYGGGNQGNVDGSTKVTLRAGDIGAVIDPEAARPLTDPKGKVFGGARMANVGGNTFVNIDGENATGYIVANYVYGGNDIAGTIGTAAAVGESIPTEIADNKEDVDDTWNSYVHISSKLKSGSVYYTQAECDEYNDAHSLTEDDPDFRTTNHVRIPSKVHEDNKKIYIGQAFAGGNGDYTYTEADGETPLKDGDGNYIIQSGGVTIATKSTPFNRPDLDKTFIDVHGGSIVYAYGGGNNATVKQKAVIHVDNPSNVTNEILVNSSGVEGDADTYTTYDTNGSVDGYTNLLSNERFKEMGINLGFSLPSSAEFQIGRFFGGNNKATMAIRPIWLLDNGKIRRIYSGGNMGAMTAPEGLLLEIPSNSNIIADYVYGGCRMADVIPTVNGEYKACLNLTRANYPEAGLKYDYDFPNELSARVLVRGGDINNVYGGNDVTGKVRGGSAVGIYTSVRGDVYGGGNGAYPYTDKLGSSDEIYGDLYYTYGGYSSIQALNRFRPDAEQVSVFLWGADAEHPTVIKGSVYVGGNCATVENENKSNPKVELKIGPHVIANEVYLGNNGEGMVDEEYLKLYADDSFSSLDLTDGTTFKEYMEGVVMDYLPSVVFSKKNEGDPVDYEEYSSMIGSFYCGGNVGSMGYKDKNTYSFDQKLIIFDKLVGGCNNADVKEGAYNAAYNGGILGAKNERGATSSEFYTDSGAENGNIKDRLELRLENLTIVPKRWDDTFTLVTTSNKTLTKYKTYYRDAEGGGEFKAVGTEIVGGPITYYEKTMSGDTPVYTPVPTNKLNAGEEYYATQLRSSIFVADGTEVIDGTATYYKLSTPGSDLEWNTAKYVAAEKAFDVVANDAVDDDTRLMGGNIYGGCYNSGHVNGNVVINVNENVMNKNEIFGTGTGLSGVDYEDQRDDVMAIALTTFGAGYGDETEIWGSTTVNLTKGYTFQVFGGGEAGIVGKSVDEGTYIASNGRQYKFDERYSATVNLMGDYPGYSEKETGPVLAETEYIYGGGNEGDVCGNTCVNLGDGRIYDAFGGASDANILGHTEVYIGRQPKSDGTFQDGFPWVRDIVYGGNDFGGTIHGGLDDDGILVGYESGYDFTKRVRNYATVKDQLHGYEDGKIPDVLKSSSYVEYLMGRVDTIFGGSYGYYDYTLPLFDGATTPKQKSSFVNIRPNSDKNDLNAIVGVFGGGTGYPKQRQGDESQDRSYVLVDIPEKMDCFKETEVFGSGSYNGMGMRFDAATTFGGGFNHDRCSAIVDLLHGQIGYAYGGSYNEGVTARTVVNVPTQSTINVKKIFGGAYGTQILPPCDVIQAVVNYNNTSENASVGTIYGGNNSERRSLFTQVNISSPVWSDKSKGYMATVYGAGLGIDTWSEHTQVNLLSGAKVFEAYGGGEMGHVLNAESIQKYMNLYKTKPSPQISAQDPKWSDPARWDGEVGEGTIKTTKLHEGDEKTIKEEWDEDWEDAWKLGKYYTPITGDPAKDFMNYFDAFAALENTSLVRKAEMDDRDYTGYTEAAKLQRLYIYNTNVIIHEGAEVLNYAYGGGLGDENVSLSGDVYGDTYIALLGGKVKKDIYAAGTAGAVNDVFAVGHYDASENPFGFTASANAYIKGGSCRNVYGGGWLGNVGHHTGAINAPTTGDIAGETHVVIGDLAGSSFTNGIPTVRRNAYGGGEGGAVIGTAYLTLNNGYVGYQYNPDGSDIAKTEGFDEHYEEKIEDETQPTPNTLLTKAGCMFGGGYIDNSSVDKTCVKIYGGHVRNSAFGGGEIAAIGRGDMKEKAGGTGGYELKGIYRPGKTLIEMYGGQVHRDVFGGGRGYDNLDRHGSLHCPGYVFGQTEVHIHGGEIGTASGVSDGDGNVFGGGDIGFVYSAYEKADGTFGKGVKDGIRYDGLYEGYYFQHAWDDEGAFVTVEVPTYYTAKEATEYNTAHSLEPGDAGYKKEGDPKGTKTERQFTEDCKVLIEPHMKVLPGKTITFGTGGDAKTYNAGDYVPIDDLNMLKDKETDAAKWACLDQTGVIIHNGVFAGGNTPSGTITTSANTASVFGNATASIHDIYHRDMITLGTRHTGGLYGDGNLTLVDGYRELNITNYGTDYYSIAKEISIDQYHALPQREADYYELKYTCLKPCVDKDGTHYKDESEGSKASTITADDMQNLFVEIKNGVHVSVKYEGVDVLVFDVEKNEWVPNTAADANFWKESGVLPVYAGRLMNSIQRADFCGVWGSRMVMQGALDRVPEEADYTNYTINRVREVSLNKKYSEIAADLALKAGKTPATNFPEDQDPEDFENQKNALHGNYFGIYNVVHYLGSLTSDVRFTDVRKTDNTNDVYKGSAQGKEYGTASFYDWKIEHCKDKTRNNGNSHNKVAVASGVYLEITTEESTGDGLYEKVWGPITGVVELDLINVAPGIGGGFVYAKNIHGVPYKTYAVNTTVTALNRGAATKWDYDYEPADDDQKEWESSGNFVHSTQTIIDDCHNVSYRYKGPDKVPAHKWYIKGSTYVHDQYISAYTGQPNAYSETVDIPLTIAAASHGRLTLLNVMPNRYAYYSSEGVELGEDKKMIINDKPYYKNDPISYWDYYLLSASERNLFVPKTYVNCITCMIDGEEYKAGSYVMTPEKFATYKTTFPAGKTSHTYTDAEGNPIKDADDNEADDDYIFRESNVVSHGEGYILTYEVNNPAIWDNWYTPKSDATAGGKITLAAYEASNAETKALYEDGPTYHLISSTGAVLGQREYQNGDLISKDVYDTYIHYINEDANRNGTLDPGEDFNGNSQLDNHLTSSNGTQATFEKAYIVTNKITVTEGGHEIYYNPGTAVPKSFYDAHTSDCEEAYICTKSIQITKDDIIYKDSKLKASDVTDYTADVASRMNAIYSGASAMSVEAIKALPTTSTFTAERKKTLVSLANARDDINIHLVAAYYCTSAPALDGEGNPVHYYYGGNYYESGINYRGLEAWSAMSYDDRQKFTFNYDALDLLIDPLYSYAEGEKYQYDAAAGTLAGAQGNAAHYSLETSVDYTAEYNSGDDSDELTNYVTVKHSNGTSGSVKVLQKGDELSREEFENKLVNEKRHYAAVTVKNATLDTESGKYLAYVVNTSFQIGSTPYAVGETISSDTYKSLPATEKTYVTEFKFSDGDHTSEAVYYYCRESYPMGTTVTPISSSGDSGIPGASGGVSGGEVLLGTLITKSNYDVLPNEQMNFTIHGVAPTETSTLYVSSESDIYDLSKEKIITVIYKYDYDETDTNGNVTPMSERHVLNIHLTFESGVPIVEDIDAPDIILPGDYVTLREPNVTPGAFELTGGGWELFATQRDAESHVNGVEYDPNFNPLYWYQDGYFVSYYAKSYVGRTYSNAVPVSVANYHDLADVMSDDNKEHHMYIDHKNVKRDSKIYINDYSGSGKNGLDLFKNLYDLSLLTSVASSGDLKDHALLNERVKAGDNLEFFLRTDIDHSTKPNPDYDPLDPDSPETIPDPWTSIGSVDDGLCFKGNLHGDGHTISGLDHSLFENLCGNVYNLGVTGSFTSAGVADSDTKKLGYVESCWVKTTGTPSSSVRAVFGNPTDDTREQTVNCYYPESNSSYLAGKAIQKRDTAFYNGEVAYDLNNFYLYKRYNDNANPGGTATYKYYKSDVVDPVTDKLIPQDGTYATNADLCSSGYNNIKYVEERFADGDFRYAAGVIPDTDDERTYIDPDDDSKKPYWYPIWPDDYLFFGQKLTYGWTSEAHQNVPTAVNRDDGRIDYSETGNRVYRAPAYYRSKTMGVAHFNPNAVFAQKEKLSDEQKEYNETHPLTPIIPRNAYPNMTAIDFTGYNDVFDGASGSQKPYTKGTEGTHFYDPLLDDDGLTGIRNADETQNLLVYIPQSGTTAQTKTNSAVTAANTDPDYAETNTTYRTVDRNKADVRFHIVTRTANDATTYTSNSDHFLVDKQDFNAPIAYTFDDAHRMWYQRYPSDKEDGYNEYVDFTDGWQGISLPFTAELVTTDTKGEITHFYSGSKNSMNDGTGKKKIGHEYWLREFDALDTGVAPMLADFNYPDASGKTKTVTNTFLWDYYYNASARHNHYDKNKDTYQTYYDGPRSYNQYPLLAAHTPYLLGLPGPTYYEFDLSGKFEATTTDAPNPIRLAKQYITFASAKGESIGISDDEMTGVTQSGYTFKPSYMNETLAAGNFVINSDGNAYVQLSDEGSGKYRTTGSTYADAEAFEAAGTLYSDADGTTVAGSWTDASTVYYSRVSEISKNEENKITPALSAFRPYFTGSGGGVAKEYKTRSIVFSRNTAEMYGQEDDDISVTGELIIRGRDGRIFVTSMLQEAKDIRIVTSTGAQIDHYIIQPGETRQTRISASGVYLVNKKKIAVRVK